MERTVRDTIVTALDSLEKKHLKKFRNKLIDWPIKEGYNKIPKGLLEEADPDDTADRIIQFYTTSYGIEVTLAVLEAINERKVADDLQKDLRNVKGFVPQTEASGAVASSKEPRKHFVIEHQTDIISRTCLVNPILDELLQKDLLEDEAYNTILNMKPTQEQMRKLYTYVRSWGDSHRDIFYEALKKNNAPLIQDLEK